MKGTQIKKICAWICTIVLMVSGISFMPKADVSAQTYDQLTYTALDGNLGYSIVNNSIVGWGNPWYGDGGITFQFIYAGEPTNIISATKIKVNGADAAVGGGVVTEIASGCVKVNPTQFANNAYTTVEVTTTTGSAFVVFKKGTPASAGEVTSSGTVDPQPGETTNTQPGETQ